MNASKEGSGGEAKRQRLMILSLLTAPYQGRFIAAIKHGNNIRALMKVGCALWVFHLTVFVCLDNKVAKVELHVTYYSPYWELINHE